jgi:hypothetical protein
VLSFSMTHFLFLLSTSLTPSPTPLRPHMIKTNNQPSLSQKHHSINWRHCCHGHQKSNHIPVNDKRQNTRWFLVSRRRQADSLFTLQTLKDNWKQFWATQGHSQNVRPNIGLWSNWTLQSCLNSINFSWLNNKTGPRDGTGIFLKNQNQKHSNYFSELELEVLHKNKEPPNTGPDCGPLGRTHQNKRLILMH